MWKKFPKYYVRDRMVFFEPEDAVAVFRYLKYGPESLLGYDAFLLYDDGRIQPSLEHSWDFTGISDPPATTPYEHAIQRILSFKDLGFVFEISHRSVKFDTVEDLVRKVFGSGTDTINNSHLGP